MRTSLLPAVRVEPSVREEAESVLAEGENLSSFIEGAVTAQIARRKAERAFLKRGLASLEEARASGKYYAPDFVLDELETMLAKAEAGKP